MINHKSLCTASSLALVLFNWFTITVGATALSRAHADVKTLTSDKRVDVRSIEEKRVATSEEKSYKQQMQALERHYRNLANKVKQNGGNADSLFAAAEHFKAASEVMVK